MHCGGGLLWLSASVVVVLLVLVLVLHGGAGHLHSTLPTDLGHRAADAKQPFIAPLRLM